MAQLFGSSWLCLLLAGVWSLACGYLLRRAWTSEAEEDKAAQLASSRNELLRLRADVDMRNTRVQALETDLAGQRNHVAEVEAKKAAELELMTQKLASFEAKAAGFDLARVTSLKTVAERDQTITDLGTQLQSVQAALADARTQAEASRSASAKAAADLATAHTAWKVERSSLVDEHGLKLAALDRTHAEVKSHHESELAALVAKVTGLAVFEAQAKELGSKLQTNAAALQTKDDALAALDKRVKALEPLQAKLAAAESELATARSAWDKERASLIDVHSSKLAALERSGEDAVQRHRGEAASLTATIAGLAAFETQAQEAATKLQAHAAALRAKDDAVAALEKRVQALEPLSAKLASTEGELASAKRTLTERDSALSRSNAEAARIAETLKQRDAELAALRARSAEWEGWQTKFKQAEGELTRLRAKATELEPWQGKFEAANTELRNARTRLAELEPWQGKFTQAETELGRLRAQVAEIQTLKDQLRNLSEQRDAAIKRRDEDLARLSAELRGRIGTLETEGMEWRRRSEAADKQAALKDGQIASLNVRIEELLRAPPKVVERVVEKIVEVENIVPVAAPLMSAPVAAPRAAPTAKPKRDDLKVIEGIGPKIEKLLNDAGYLTFREVAVADPRALTVILERAGPRFALARTGTWPEQAQLLADGKMEAFKKLTDELKGGVRR